MSKGMRTMVVALGLTTICMAWLIEPLTDRSHDVVYHWMGPSSALFGPAAVETAVAWTFLTLLLLSARTPGRWRTAIWLGILVYMPWIMFRTLYLLWPSHWFPPMLGVVALFGWVLFVLAWAFTGRFETLIEFSSTVLAFVAISGALFLTQFAWSWWGARALNDPSPHPQAQVAGAASDARPRILWIVLDELSYQQVYERRYPGLQLPAFDALAAESTLFTQTVPAGIRTERVLPALLTGIPVKDIRPSADGQLLMEDSTTGKWRPFEQHNTVFEDALNANYGTAIAGWYNPYCRIMPAVLDHCYWTWGFNLADGMKPNATVGSNLKNSFAVLLSLLPGSGKLHEHISHWLKVPDLYKSEQASVIVDYREVSAANDKVLRDRSASFALVHLPIPHPPGIYDRRTGELTMGSSTYIDNLALADRYLAHVRSVLEQTGQWDSSTVIVMGDHSWRTVLLWENSQTWTAEEKRASDGGKFDPRPAYIVKLAGQHEGARIDVPFRAMETRKLLDELIAGRLRTADELRAWAEKTEEASGNDSGWQVRPRIP